MSDMCDTDSKGSEKDSELFECYLKDDFVVEADSSTDIVRL